MNHFTAQNGLLSNTVYSGLSDSKGYLWFSTDQGVSRYDGFEFVHFTIDEGLTDNEVFKIFEDSKGRIWFLTYNGKPCYYQNYKIHNPENTSFLADFKNKIFFTQMIEDADGKIWFFKEFSREYYVLENEQVIQYQLPAETYFLNSFKLNESDYFVYNSKIDNTSWKYSIVDVKNPETVKYSFIDPYQCDNFYVFQNTLYFGNRGLNNLGPLNVYRVNDFLFEEREATIIDSSSQLNKIYHVATINKQLLIATNNGVTLLNSTGSIKKHLLPGIFTTSILQDYESGLWLTTKNDGVFYFANLESQTYKDISESVSLIRLNPYDSTQLYFIAQNSIYISKKKSLIKLQFPVEFARNEIVTDIAFFDSTSFLVGNGHGLCFYNGSDFKIAPGKSGIKQILVEGDSLTYARSTDLVKQHFNQLFKPLNLFNQPYRTLYSQRVLCVAKTEDNALLIGNNFGAFSMNVDGTMKAIESIETRIKKIVLSQNNYRVFCSDIQGIFLMYEGNVVHLTTSNGLASNCVNSCVFDYNNNLWVATSKGLSFIDLTNRSIKNYGAANGIIDEKVNEVHIVNDTCLFLATASGVYLYNPKKINETSKPRVEIQSLKVNATELKPAPFYEFNHNENNIEILLSGISFNNNNLEFYYKIENQSEQWVKINGRLMTFVNLPSGNYSILIKCKNTHQKWSDTHRIEIIIHPPFYLSWWFIILSSTILIFGTVSFFYVYQKRRLKEKEIQLMLSETKQLAFRAQLNPHFVFNSLNSIQYLYMSKKDDQALDYLNKFSILLRNILNHSNKPLITITEEIENLKLYLEIEQKRTNDVFDYEITVEPDVDTFSLQIPSMLIQPFVENSIWHGFKSIKQKGEIRINVAKLNHEFITILINDNGSGFDNTSDNRKTEGKINESKGMKLINDRISALNRMNSKNIKLNINSTKSGTTVELIFPLKY